MARVAWQTGAVSSDDGPGRVWADAAVRGWLPNRPAHFLVHVDATAHPTLVRDTARALVAFLRAQPVPPRVEILDTASMPWSDVACRDLRREPRYLVEVAGLRDGARLPEAWLADVFIVTIAGVRADARLGLRGVLAAQATLLDAPDTLDVDVAFAAHRLLRANLFVACGPLAHDDSRSGSWWAASQNDVALERAVATQCGVVPDTLPMLRHFARHEVLTPSDADEVSGAPQLTGYVVAAWRISVSRACVRAAETGRRLAKDVQLGAQNLRRLPTFLQRRVPMLARLGRGA